MWSNIAILVEWAIFFRFLKFDSFFSHISLPRYFLVHVQKISFFLNLFYSNEIQNIEVESSVLGLFEFRVENSFLIIHVSIRLVTYFWVLVLTPILCQHFVIQNFNKLTNTRLYIRYSSPIIYLKVFFDYLGFFMSQH